MNILNRFTGLNKPLAGARLNWGHPLAPSHPRACVLPLNEPMEAIRDAANKRTFSRVVPATETNWVASGLPVANGLGFRLFSTSSSVFTKFTAPGALDETTMSGVKYITLACIYLSLGTTSGGPRPIGNGDNRSLILEPGFNGASTAYVLAGNVAHVDTGLPWTAGNWGFFAVSSSGNQFTTNRMRAVVNDYRTNTIRTAANDSFSGIAPTSGTGSLMCLGATDTTNITASNGILYWAMIDYSEWSIDRMIELSLNPFGMFTDIANRAYFIQSSGSESKTGTETGSLSDAATLAVALSQSETGSLADAAALAAAFSQSETGSLNDAGALAAAYAQSDTSSLADAAVLAVNAPATETGSLDDAAALVVNIAVTETGTLGDVGTNNNGPPPASDTTTGTDAASLAVALTQTDTGSAADAAALLAIFGQSDTASLGDAAALAVLISVTETGSLTEFGSLGGPPPAGESSSLSDVAALVAMLTASDTFSVGDSAVVTINPDVVPPTKYFSTFRRKLSTPDPRRGEIDPR